MTLGLILTILLAVLDYTGQADLSLFEIFLPMIVEAATYVVIVIAWFAIAIWASGK